MNMDLVGLVVVIVVLGLVGHFVSVGLAALIAILLFLVWAITGGPKRLGSLR